VALLPGAGPGPVTLIGHSAGAQVMQLFASDASAPIDAGISLDTTQDYAMLTDDTWAYYTDSVISRRRQVRIPIMFVAGPDALFELADSLVRSRRTLVTVPDVRHNEFISQGVIRKQVHAGLTGDDPTGRDAAARAYVALVGYIGSWLAARAAPTDDAPAASLPLQVAHVPPGEVFPLLDEGPPRSARQLRHLFGVAAPGVLAERVVQARKTHPEAVSNQALMMLLVHTVRRGDAARARAIYDALAALEPDVSRVPELIEARATLFERIGASVEAAEWRNLLKAFAPRL
jgi:hypothetical protein